MILSIINNQLMTDEGCFSLKFGPVRGLCMCDMQELAEQVAQVQKTLGQLVGLAYCDAIGCHCNPSCHSSLVASLRWDWG